MSNSYFTGEVIEKHAALAQAIRENSTVNDKGEIVEVEKAKAFYDNLPEGVDKKTVEAVANYTNDFINAAHIAAADVAGELFEANEDVTRTKAKYGIGPRNDALFISLEEQRSYPIPKSDKVSHKAMAISAVSKVGGRGLPAIKTEISDQYANVLKKNGTFLGL